MGIVARLGDIRSQLLGKDILGKNREIIGLLAIGLEAGNLVGIFVQFPVGGIQGRVEIRKHIHRKGHLRTAGRYRQKSRVPR